jgi:UV DNA damage endonuclease
MNNIKNRLGYCCINLTLGECGVTTNRGMVKKTFLEKGIAYASELSLKNVLDLEKIINWNAEHGIYMYRMTSDLFPWVSEYEISDLPNYDYISDSLKKCGDLAKHFGQRLTFHPSPYSVLASQNESVVIKAIKELRQHGEIMDLMGLERSHYYPINVHVNTGKPTKEEAASRFCENYNKLNESVKSRLVLENDDKKSGFTPRDLYELVYKKIGIPLTFDFHHYKCNPDDFSEEEALSLCLSTWGSISAITHYSDSRKMHEDSSAKDVAHSDWIWTESLPTYNKEFDIELEVKMKELALLKLIDRL